MMLEVDQDKDETMSPPANNELTSLAYRVGALEKDLIEMRTQLNLKTAKSENDLRFQAIDDKVQSALDDIREIKQDVKDMAARDEQEQKDVAKELKSIQSSIWKIQIAALIYIVVFFVTIISGVTVAVLSNAIH